MNITFENNRTEKEVRQPYTSGVRSNVDKVTTSQVNSKGVFALDISGTVMDNKAYEGQGKTIEEVMQNAGLIDVTTQKNYMAVMSNTMSDEDFARLQKEGYHPGNTEIETVVTIIDEIKTALAKGGQHITGYTDDLDVETLKQITGSTAMAEAMMHEFAEHDIPVTKENAEEVMKAYDTVSQLQPLSDGVMKYMIRNHMEPTIDNIYKAQHSAAYDANKQGRGYYQDDTGYYAKKAEDYNWKQLQPQMEKVIRQAGQEVSEETLDNAKWLIEKGMPLTDEALVALDELKHLEIPATAKEVVSATMGAVSDGKKAGEANLVNGKSAIAQALEYMQDVNSISNEAVDKVAAEGVALNIRNLKAAQIQISMNYSAESYAVSINGRRVMEEVRLQMSVEANLHLIKSGFSIDTSELEQLVDALKLAQQQTEDLLFGDKGTNKAGSRTALYQNTLSTVRELYGMPAALVGKFAFQSRVQITMTTVSATEGAFTLQTAYEHGAVLRSAYEKAGESYEALMTAPRADLGDSIKKAFRNVDDLLKDMRLEVSEANRRAVRILGYNQMEISEENIDAVKTTDLSIQRVLNKMTPAATMKMIRDGVNPLTMNMEELETYLNQQEKSPEQDFEKYSEYLYKLERNHQVTEPEREAYIGIYRLFRQLEKTDGAAIGMLLNQEAELTVKNLLSAMRSSKKRGMEVKVDDGFAGINASYVGKSISEQIETGVKANYYQKLAADILDRMDGSKMQAVPADGDMSLEQFAQMLHNTEENEEINRTYIKEQAALLRQAVMAEESTVKELLDYEQPVTANHLMAAGLLVKERGKAAGRLYELADAGGNKEELEAAMNELQEAMTDAESAVKAYEKLEQVYTKVLEDAVYEQDDTGRIDVREISSLYKQISFNTNMAKEENYEVPVQIGSEITSINLKIVHSQSENGKVTASMDSLTYGRVMAQFYLTVKNESEYQLSGYVACDHMEGRDLLEKSSGGLKKILEQADIKIVSLNYIYNGELSLNMTGQTMVKEETVADTGFAVHQVSTKKLYETAKAFIGYIQER